MENEGIWEKLAEYKTSYKLENFNLDLMPDVIKDYIEDINLR